MTRPAALAGRGPVRAVLFDAVGTLLVPRPPVAEVYHAHARRFGSSLGREEIARRFAAAFARQEAIDRAAGDRTSEPRERERWRAIVAETIHDANDADGLFDALWNHFALASHWRLFDDAPAAIARARDSAGVVGMASNFDARLHGIVANMAGLAPIARVFVSSELGWRKPAAEFFRAIEAALGLRPEEILLVGDDVENDHRAAAAAGWRAVLVDRSGKEADASWPAAYRVASLLDL